MSELFASSAKTELHQRRARANWSKLLLRPIRLADGTSLQTLGEAALQILELPPAPSSRLAAERIMDAALGEGDMVATEIAVRIALGKPSNSQGEPERLKSLYSSLAEEVAAKNSA